MPKYFKIVITISAVMLSLVFVSAMFNDSSYSDPFSANKTGGLAFVPANSSSLPIIPASVYYVNASQQSSGDVNLGYGDVFAALNGAKDAALNAMPLLNAFLVSMELPTEFIAIFIGLMALIFLFGIVTILGGRDVET